jgi:predicted PurR-regulated permease PerM
MQLTKENIQKIMLMGCGCILFAWLLNNISNLGIIFSGIWKLLAPFAVGGMIAFVMNLPMTKIESLIVGKKTLKERKWARGLAIAITMVLFIGIISFILFLLVPELVNNLKSLAEQIPGFLDGVKAWLLEIARNNPNWKAQIVDIANNLTSSNSVQNIVTNSLNSLMDGSKDFISSVTSGLTTAVLAIVFAIYLLGQKEYLIRGSKKLVYAFVPKKYADKTIEIFSLANKTFAGFVSGQCLEAIILSAIFFLVLFIGGFPYALLISVITFVLAFVPMLGATFSAIIGAVLIFPISPIRAIIFLLLSLVIQQVENNLIYPKVVGKSVGLAGIWTLVAIIIFGSLFGIIGMIIGLPIASIAYALLGETVNKKLEEKRLKRKLEQEPILKPETAKKEA